MGVAVGVGVGVGGGVGVATTYAWRTKMEAVEAVSVVNAPVPPAAKFPETKIEVYVPGAVITAAAHAGGALGVGVGVAAAPGVMVAGVIDAAVTPLAVAEIVALVSGAPV